MLIALRTRYLLGEILWWTIGLYLGFILVMLGNDFFISLQFFTQQQVPTSLVAKLLLLKWPFWIGLGIPVGVLFGILVGVGRMAGDNEIQAMMTSGVSIWRMSIPVFIVGLVSAALMWAVNEQIAPPLLQQYGELSGKLFASQPMERIKTRVFLKGPEERFFYFETFDAGRLEMQGIYIFQFEGYFVREIILCQSGKQVGDLLVLSQCLGVKFQRSTGVESTQKFDSMEISLKRELYRNIQIPRNPIFMSVADLIVELRNQQNNPAANPKQIHNIETIMHFKRSIPLSPVFFALMAFGLVARAAKAARYLALFYAVFLWGIYYILLSGTQIFAAAGILPPIVAGWMSTGIFFIIAVFSIYRASR